ncbi:CRTAC1 family protein [Rhodopirellula sallentina]|nr:CRTAC1 family protein [Rhodopirellula sallentina]
MHRKKARGSVKASTSQKATPSPQNGKTAGAANRRPMMLALLAVVALAVVAFLVVQNGNNKNADVVASNTSTSDAERLELTRVALAKTENLQFDDADDAWNTLHDRDPQNASVALNRALNRVLRVDSLSSQATNAALERTEQKLARSKLPEAIASAREGIEAYSAIAENSVIAQWLAAEVDLHEASLLPASMTKSIRKEVYDRLSQSVQGDTGKQPQSVILGGVLAKVIEQIEDPIDGLPRDVLADAAKAFGSLSDNHPDNLFFALRAARLNIESRDQRAAVFIKRSADLASGIKPLIGADTQAIGKTPDELVAEIVLAIDSADWQTAENSNLLWFNVLNSSEIMKTDRRRAMPHPLDRLSFASLRDLAASVAKEKSIQQGTSLPQFKRLQLPDSDAIRVLQPIDFDLDLDTDLAGIDSEGVLRLWRNEDGQWSSAGSAKMDIDAAGLIATDLFVVDSSAPGRLRANRGDSASDDLMSSSRHDTFQHLVVYGDDGVRVVSIDGRSNASAQQRLQPIEADIGLNDVQGVTAAIAGDLEADGDLDLIFGTREHGVRMFINRGNRTFFELPTQGPTFAADSPVSAFAIGDVDRDLDLDIISVHKSSGRVSILENMLHLQFRGRYLENVPAVRDADFVAIEEVDGNVSWDLVVGGSESAAVVYTHTSDAGVWNVEQVISSRCDASAHAVMDLDNDSWMEVIADNQMSRIGPWGWSAWVPVDGLTAIQSICPSDFDRDGRVDVAVVTDDGAFVGDNGTEPVGHYINLRFKGIDDNASGRVNHYAIGSVLETRFGPHYRARIVTSPSTHFGLHETDQVGSVRAIFPNGLTQTIANPPLDALVEEEQTLKGSCPYLYAWDGDKFAFVTDCLWAAPLGLQVAHGVVAKDRPWEYLKLDGSNIHPKDGRYELRITEELWEVAYFDEVQLTAVDHPSDVEIWTNEKVGPGNIATPTIFSFASDDRHPIHSATDTTGRDVTSLLADADRQFVKGFDRRLRQGLCEPHWIDLDFGEQFADRVSQHGETSQPVYLVLTGWIMPTDASLNIQIDQNPALDKIEFPSVWVPSSESPSEWSQVIPFMGFPGGKTKTIVVDVSEILNPEDPRFRIRTSAQIYWDSAEVVTQTTPADHQSHDCELQSAELTFHGFSRRRKEGPRQPETYDYQDASDAARWPPLSGKMSVYGECTGLVQTWDDRMAVISGGDEIRLSFSVPPQEPPPGWTRDFVLHCVGWDKDADLNTLTGQQIGPLPFRKMTQYPPGLDQHPNSVAINLLNQSHLGRKQTFRSFWYRETNAPAMQFSK